MFLKTKLIEAALEIIVVDYKIIVTVNICLLDYYYYDDDLLPIRHLEVIYNKII